MDAILRLKALTEQMPLEPDAEQTGWATHESPLHAPYLDKTENCPEAVFVHPAVLPDGLLENSGECNVFPIDLRAGFH